MNQYEVKLHPAARGSVWDESGDSGNRTVNMYVSYLLEKDSSMYSNPVRHPSLNLNHQNFVPAPPQYSDFTGYHHHHHHHHVPGFNDASQTSSPYPPPAPPAPALPRDDWTPYGTPVAPGASSNPGQISFGPPEFPPSNLQPSALLHPSISSSTSIPQLSPTEQRRNPYEWMRRSATPANPGGKTRTKDKYRVVYTDHQRLELEKEFHYSRYITIRRKAELATALSLSERQVKIWFQNRRAKERKMNKKKLQQPQASTTTSTPPGSNITSSTGALVSSSMPMTIKEEY